MKHLKKLFLSILVALVLVSGAGCAKKDEASNSKKESTKLEAKSNPASVKVEKEDKSKDKE